MGSPESGAAHSLPGRRGPVGSMTAWTGRRGPVGSMTAWTGRRGVRVAGALGLFVTAALLLTGLGLALTGHQVEGWTLVARGEVPDDAAYEGLSFSLLAEWENVREEPPPSVAALDGRRFETYGLAKPAEGGSGFWLVTDPIAVGEARKPIIEKSVWVGLPPGTSPSPW